MAERTIIRIRAGCQEEEARQVVRFAVTHARKMETTADCKRAARGISIAWREVRQFVGDLAEFRIKYKS